MKFQLNSWILCHHHIAEHEHPPQARFLPWFEDAVHRDQVVLYCRTNCLRVSAKNQAQDSSKKVG